jgi:glycosyltransferase involved in cell wall biosynthesis
VGEAAIGLVPPGDPASLAATLARFAGDEALRLRLGAWGREAAMDYDCRTRAPDFVALYREALARAATRPPARQKRKI